MAQNPTPVAPLVVEQIPSTVGTTSAIASAHAPIIFFDGVPNFGFNPPVCNMTLEVARFSAPASGSGSVLVDRVQVAHLRFTLDGMRQLKQAIEQMELMAEPVPDPPKSRSMSR